MCSADTFELSPRARRLFASRAKGTLPGYDASEGSSGTETSMSFISGQKNRMIAQRQTVHSRLKCCRQKGLTCPRSAAYDGLFTCGLHWETWLYETAAWHVRA